MAGPNSIPKGTVLADKYEVVRELGRGGMAAVYEAVNLTIEKRVAVKLLAGHLAASQTVVERFLREARAVAKIRSPHICDIFDSGRLDDGTPFLVMELLEGESLYDAMCRDRQMSPEVTLAIILQVSRGLARAHGIEIVHRDLKPENIFLTVDNDGQLLVKVLDFGLAKFYDPVDTKGKGGKHARLTREGAVFGTPAYMSPEQVRGQAAADTRADLWALACITYECFTGTTVWSTEDGVAMTFAQIATAPIPDARRYRPDLPTEFSDWFIRALNRDIEARFQTVADFADGLAGAFNYRSKGGGLDAGLVNRITTRASTGAGPEFEAVTERISSRAPPPRPPNSGSQPSAASPVELRQETPSVPPPNRSTNRAFMITALLVAVVAGAAAAIAKSEPPPTPLEAKTFGGAAAQLVHTEPSEMPGHKVVARHPWLPLVREAQALIEQQDHERALATLERVYEQHRHGMVKNLMDQIPVAVAGKQGGARCQVKGYARPRRYDMLSQDRKPVPSTAPVIARGLDSAIMTWADARGGERHAYAVLLDDALRNRSLPVDITPEGAKVQTPTVLPVAQRFMAAYWDGSRTAGGVYVRWLRPDGVIGGPAVAVTKAGAGAFFSDAARNGEGFVVGWADRREADSVDLFLRFYDQNLEAQEDVVRVTDYINRGTQQARVRELRVAHSGNTVHAVFTYVQGPLSQIRYLAVPSDTKAPGLPDLEGPKKERVLGEVIEISDPLKKAATPGLSCNDEGCFVTWQEGRQGAGVAFVDNKTGKRQWHKLFARAGRQPAVGIAPSGDIQLAWVESGRLTTATLGREGVGPVSKVARVVGEHPPPSIAPGAKTGEWYIAWLDYESSHLEPYAVRVECQ
jgi:eukaryotic-like serine/threonine-protein kinase